MVRNPIYDQGSIPLYDTIPTTLSETLNDPEGKDASGISGFTNSSSTLKAANAYVDESNGQHSQRSPLDVSNNEITSSSL